MRPRTSRLESPQRPRPAPGTSAGGQPLRPGSPLVSTSTSTAAPGARAGRSPPPPTARDSVCQHPTTRSEIPDPPALHRPEDSAIAAPAPDRHHRPSGFDDAVRRFGQQLGGVVLPDVVRARQPAPRSRRCRRSPWSPPPCAPRPGPVRWLADPSPDASTRAGHHGRRGAPGPGGRPTQVTTACPGRAPHEHAPGGPRRRRPGARSVPVRTPVQLSTSTTSLTPARASAARTAAGRSSAGLPVGGAARTSAPTTAGHGVEIVGPRSVAAGVDGGPEAGHHVRWPREPAWRRRPGRSPRPPGPASPRGRPRGRPRASPEPPARSPR